MAIIAQMAALDKLNRAQRALPASAPLPSAPILAATCRPDRKWLDLALSSLSNASIQFQWLPSTGTLSERPILGHYLSGEDHLAVGMHRYACVALEVLTPIARLPSSTTLVTSVSVSTVRAARANAGRK